MVTDACKAPVSKHETSFTDVECWTSSGASHSHKLSSSDLFFLLDRLLILAITEAITAQVHVRLSDKLHYPE